jgi:hypothetical protein
LCVGVTNGEPERGREAGVSKPRSAAEQYEVAFAALEAAGAQSRVERMQSEARVARLKLAAELERQGRYDEAREITEQVRAEQNEIGST